MTIWTSCHYERLILIDGCQINMQSAKRYSHHVNLTRCLDDVIRWKNFRVTDPLWEESTGHRWIPLTKASDAELWCFLWSAPEQTVEQKSRRLWFDTPSSSLWRLCNDVLKFLPFANDPTDVEMLSLTMPACLSASHERHCVSIHWQL